MHNHAALGMVLAAAQLPHYPYRSVSGAVLKAWGKDHWYTNIFELGALPPPERR